MDARKMMSLARDRETLGELKKRREEIVRKLQPWARARSRVREQLRQVEVLEKLYESLGDEARISDEKSAREKREGEEFNKILAACSEELGDMYRVKDTFEERNERNNIIHKLFVDMIFHDTTQWEREGEELECTVKYIVRKGEVEREHSHRWVRKVDERRTGTATRTIGETRIGANEIEPDDQPRAGGAGLPRKRAEKPERTASREEQEEEYVQPISSESEESEPEYKPRKRKRVEESPKKEGKPDTPKPGSEWARIRS